MTSRSSSRMAMTTPELQAAQHRGGGEHGVAGVVVLAARAADRRTSRSTSSRASGPCSSRSSSARAVATSIRRGHARAERGEAIEADAVLVAEVERRRP